MYEAEENTFEVYWQSRVVDVSLKKRVWFGYVGCTVVVVNKILATFSLDHSI